jgi:hypothetical protein
MSTLIQQFGGRVLEASGGRYLAEFGNTIETVSCALEIQREFARRNAKMPPSLRLEFRIGVNFGEIVEGGGRVYGEGVNVAVRVSELAESGGVCLSAVAYEQARNKAGLECEYFHTVFMGDEQLPVFRVLGKKGTKIKAGFYPAAVLLVISLLYMFWKNIPFNTAGLLILGFCLVFVGFLGFLARKFQIGKPLGYFMVILACALFAFAYLRPWQSLIFVYEIQSRVPGGLLVDWQDAVTQLISQGSAGSRMSVKVKKGGFPQPPGTGMIRDYRRKVETENSAALMIGGSLAYSKGKIKGDFTHSRYYGADRQSLFEADFGEFCDRLKDSTYTILTDVLRVRVHKGSFLLDTEVRDKICTCQDAVKFHIEYYRNPRIQKTFDTALDKYVKCLGVYPDAYRYRYNLALLYLTRHELRQDERSLIQAQKHLITILEGNKDTTPRPGYFPAMMQLGRVHRYSAALRAKPEEKVDEYSKALVASKKSIEFLENAEYREPSLEKRAYFRYANVVAGIWHETTETPGFGPIADTCLTHLPDAKGKLELIYNRISVFKGDISHLIGDMTLIQFVKEADLDTLRSSEKHFKRALAEVTSASAEALETDNCFFSTNELTSRIHCGLARVSNYEISHGNPSDKGRNLVQGLERMATALKSNDYPGRMFEAMKKDRDLAALWTEYTRKSGLELMSLSLLRFMDSVEQIKSNSG